MHKLEAIIFDWAGTVVDFGCCAPVRAMADALAEFGIEVALEDVRRFMGLGKREHIAALLALTTVAEQWQDTFGSPVDSRAIDRVYAAFLPLQARRITAFSDLIPGASETVAALRGRGLKIGSTTGYPREILAPVAERAAAQGYRPDWSVAVDEVPQGRPHPAMALENVIRLSVSAVSRCVKIDDTPTGIAEGLNAGMWTVALAATGNEVGLTRAEFEALAPDERTMRVNHARDRLQASGAHYVIDGITELPPVIDAIEARLARGERP